VRLSLLLLALKMREGTTGQRSDSDFQKLESQDCGVFPGTVRKELAPPIP
jgi:hypothetical protein